MFLNVFGDQETKMDGRKINDDREQYHDDSNDDCLGRCDQRRQVDFSSLDDVPKHTWHVMVMLDY